MRHLAMTGIVTTSMIDLIRSGSDMRATPPSLRMSAGTRSSAITAHAPASCASRACSGVTTSMITPPLSIWASPAFSLKVPFCAPLPLPEGLVSAIGFEFYAGDYGPGLSTPGAQRSGLEPLQGAVEVAPEHLPVQEANGDLPGRSLGSEIGIDGQLDPLDRGHGDPGGLVVLEPPAVVDLDQEVGLIEVEVAGGALQSLVVE